MLLSARVLDHGTAGRRRGIGRVAGLARIIHEEVNNPPFGLRLCPFDRLRGVAQG